MPKIKLSASSFHSVRFNVTNTVEIDDEEWDEMDEDERTQLCDELADSFRDEVVGVGWEVEGN